MTQHTPFGTAMEYIVDCNGKAIAKLENGVTLDTGRLLAAAPDLLKACKGLLGYALELERNMQAELDDSECGAGTAERYFQEIASAREAIAKATE